MYDLILKNGRLLDPAMGFDRMGSIAFADGKIAMIDPPEGAQAAHRVDVRGRIISAGLIDMHVHVYEGGTSLGVLPEEAANGTAATTLVDAGSAGAGNFDGFSKHVIASAPVRILAYLNISFAGIFGFGRDFSVGEGFETGLLQTGECRDAIEAHRDLVVGIKARVGPSSSGPNGILPLELALVVAEAVRVGVMVHIEPAPPALSDVVSRLRPGDVLTHCCRPLPNAVAVEDGDILPECLEARARGVLFDVGHGRGSFSFASFRRMADRGFLPDIVSSDIHAFNHRQRGVDLLTTMSKLLALGVPLETVVQMATANPARALRRPDLGRLEVGATGDASVLAITVEPLTLADSTGATLQAEQHFVAAGRVVSGRWTALAGY